MNTASSSRSNTMFNVPSFTIEIDGYDLKQQGLDVKHAMVDLGLGSINVFSITLTKISNPPGAFDWIDNDILSVGRSVVIKIGYVDQLVTMLVAMISNIKVFFPSDGMPFLEIIGDDPGSTRKIHERRKNVIAMRYGEDLLSFSPEIDRESQAGTGLNDDLAIRKMTSLTVTEVSEKKRSRQVLNNIQKDLTKGIGECIGSPEVIPGRTLMLEGLGKRFSGAYQVIGSIHTVDQNTGYRTTFSVMKK
jgi:phage protein D